MRTLADGWLRVVTAAERPDLAALGAALAAEVWPEYTLHGDVAAPGLARLDKLAPDFQVLVVDEHEGELVARGQALPIAWDGSVEGLPAGLDGVLAAGAAPAGGATALAGLSVEVSPRHRAGVSRVVLGAMVSTARGHGLPHVVIPARPTWKNRYPLVPIARYAAWRRPDGLPFDPWLRIHVRLGASVLRPEPESLRVTAPLADWEAWTGLDFPESGDYWFPRGLAPLAVDRERGVGVYCEPAVWVQHRAAASLVGQDPMV